MSLVEFLIAILEAHAQTLQRLAALFGEDIVIDLLENAPEGEPELLLPSIQEDWFEPETEGRNHYAQLEGAVKEFNLASVFEFHLWAYPYYRAFIEGPLELSDRLPEKRVSAIADEAIAHAERWLERLPIADEFRPRARSAAQLPWIRFRAHLLKSTGQRPLGAL